MTVDECAEILRSFVRHRERMQQREVTLIGSNDEEIATGKINPEADILYQAMKFALSCVQEKIQK